ncbi:MAG: hypothetical protein K8I82_16090 [Anaerolineae bacterium]|nr:hypothetical protein [Anaerolineae bacterium]
MTHKLVKNGTLVVIGFILSPLSWWNDALVNLPLAYLFSLPFTLLHNSLFLPSFILGYWLTNVLGFWMLHAGLFQPESHPFKQVVGFSLLYTLLVAVLVLLGILPPPTAIL